MNNDPNEYNKLNIVSVITKDRIEKITKKNKYRILIIIFLILLFIQILFFIFYLIFGKIILNQFTELKILLKKDNNTGLNHYNYFQNEKNDKIFTEMDRQKHIKQQNLFCQNQINNNNTKIEDKIKMVNIKFSNSNFDMFIYKSNDFLSNAISGSGSWETKETNNLLSLLDYYSKKKNIERNDIYVLDIGANIGWYTFILGNKGYNIISFEPSTTNYYILNKNYCLNNNTNIILINKGLDIEETNISIYHPLINIGNAISSNDAHNSNIKNYIKEEIILTKLEKYIPYLVNKNLALMKLDIEGSEGKAIESGKELITKYHIPFIFMEWTPKALKLKGTDPELFLKLFINNGYKISKKDFLSGEYCSFDEIINAAAINLYIIYTNFLE
jgi:FkbM family methyltransferase